MKPPGRTIGEGAGGQTRRLVDVGVALLSELDLESVLREVVEAAREVIGARYAALGVLNRDGEELERFIYAGMDAETRRMIGELPRGRGVLGELIRDPRPLRLADVNRHPHAYGFPTGHPPMKSFLGVSVMIGGKPYGNLYITEKLGADEFSPEDEETLETLAGWVAIAIENARRYTLLKEREQEAERQLREARTAADIARAVGGETDPGKVLDLVAKRARALVDARALYVMLGRPPHLEVAAHAGHRHLDERVLERELDDALLLAIFESRATIHLHHDSPPTLARLRNRLNAESVLLVPLLFRGLSVGCLVALDREPGADHGFEGEHPALLQAFADTAATAVATAKTIEAERLQQRIEVGERESERWARELHDGVLQELVATRIELAGALGSPSRSESPGGAESDEVEKAALGAVRRLDQQIDEISRLVNDLSPALLDLHGLAGALEQLALDSGRRGNFETETEIAIDATLGRSEERATYRFVQEALNNVLKHASPTKVRVSSRVVEDRVVIEIEDDGCGFDPGTIRKSFGLRGMRERIEMLGGTTSIHSRVGGGTRVTASIPQG